MKFWTGSLWYGIFALGSVLIIGQGSLWCQEVVLIFLCFSPEILNEDSQPYRSKSVCFPRFLQLPTTSTPCDVSCPVHLNSGWQCHYCDYYLCWPSPPTSMHFFLSVLSTSETFHSLVIIPHVFSSLIGLNQSISLEGYGAQLFFILGFAITDCLLLAVMGYNRYVAICNTLRYSVIMNWRVYAMMVSSVCATGFLLSLVQAVAIFRLSFCNTLIISSVVSELCWIWPVLPQSSLISWPWLSACWPSQLLPPSTLSPMSSLFPPFSRLPQRETGRPLLPACHTSLLLCLHCLHGAQVWEYPRSGSVNLRDLYCHNTFSDPCGV